ncbi:mitogen-activated protein kinase kinase [Thraustotheca clavata]|uniref:Mitogen-activated protein kinase kinase n=1 Tax=Thraustotheca clavata TaxID=74557 RepID=A0A1V9ZPA6_9STRA|nr:mitogen-activated protein kinase kinase [Thraustotheca clavata]
MRNFLPIAIAAATSFACQDVSVNWVWTGAITNSSLRLRVSASMGGEECDPNALKLFVSQEMTEIKSFNGLNVQKMSESVYLYDFHAQELASGPVQYEIRYGPNKTLRSQTGKITIPTAPGTPMSFHVAFSSCADEDSDPKVFGTIAQHEPLFFVHMGDLHYDNLVVNDVNVFRASYERMFASPAGQAMLGMDLPMAYMWDDHDYGPDNSDSTAPGREASLQAYREYVPHYPLQDKYLLTINSILTIGRPGATNPEDLPIQQAFTVGRVRFILTDLRSQRTPNEAENIPSKTVLGPKQKAWFKNELLHASGKDSGIGLIVWVNTMPWLDDERKWGHFKHEQTELVEFIKENNLNTKVPIIIASGDAHMLAADDGTYSPGNLPIFHAAALGRPGSIKGGPYSHGAIPGSGHFGLLHFEDDGNRVCARYSGRNDNDKELIGYDICNPQPGTTYHPPPVFVRKMTRMWRKARSRMITKWLHLTTLEIVTIGGIVIAIIALILRRFRSSKQEKKRD